MGVDFGTYWYAGRTHEDCRMTPTAARRIPLLSVLFACICVVAAPAAELVDGVLLVDGKPFYPLGGWDDEHTSPEYLASLGMNTSFRIPRPTDEGVQSFREHMRACGELGIQVLPYLSYGGEGNSPWPVESVRQVAQLADEPNLLAWYVGDDIGIQHLDGIRQTVTVLREHTPRVATVADYIAEETPEAKTVFTRYVDIRCQYTYPIPNSGFAPYLSFFEQQRRFVGDPLWTWTQAFMWGGTATEFGLGTGDDPGPIPSPEQMRLLCYAAVNRGVRGQLFFQHNTMYQLPERIAEAALFCHEVRLFEEHLAAGIPSFALPTNHSVVDAVAYEYNGSTLVSAMVVGTDYHRWVDEGVIEDLTIDVEWQQADTPRAFLVAFPEVSECRVTHESTETLRIHVPQLEVAGMLLLSANDGRITQLTDDVAAATRALAQLAPGAAGSWTSTASSHAVRAGMGDLTRGDGPLVGAFREARASGASLSQGDEAGAVAAWRRALRATRVGLDSMMARAERRRIAISAHEQRLLHTPFGLAMSDELRAAGEQVDPVAFCARMAHRGSIPADERER